MKRDVNTGHCGRGADSWENLPFLVLIAGKVEHILGIHLDVRADFIKGVVILVVGFRLVIIWHLVRCLVCTKLSIYT